MRSPSVRGAQTNDLWVELNCRRVGEDAWISLERVREGRQNIEGCNLDQDFAVVTPQAPTGTRSQVGVLLAGVGCAALVDHLRAASWPHKFRPHLPEKYDGTTNPSMFLQVYVTAITSAGGNTAVMATYFHVTLSGPARTWLMNLAPGSIYSWEELCARFVANFASAYQQHGVEAHLHAVRQEPGENVHLPLHQGARVLYLAFLTLLSSRPSVREYVMRKCWKSWPRMMWRLSPHSSLWPTNAPELLRAVHGTRPHRLGLPSRVLSPRMAKGRRRTAGMRGHNLPPQLSQPWLEDEAAAISAPGHRGVAASHAQCILMLATAPRNAARSSSLRNVSVSDASSRPKTAPRPIVDLIRRRSTMGKWLRENKNSGINHPRGTSRTSPLGILTPGMTATAARSWELTSRRNVKSLHREVLSATPEVPKVAPHQRWRSTTISFGAPDCPDNMAGADILPLITAPVITNMRLHHVLIDDGAGLNVISHDAFKQLQIPGSRLGPSRPFSGVGP
jgi:hypothetical protein